MHVEYRYVETVFTVWYLQVIGPLKPMEDFIEEDFNLLERFMMSSATGRIEKKIKLLKLDSNRFFLLCFLVSFSYIHTYFIFIPVVCIAWKNSSKFIYSISDSDMITRYLFPQTHKEYTSVNGLREKYGLC